MKLRIPDNAIIAHAKLVDYLLEPRPWDDKSKFLSQAGFHRASPEILETAIRRLASITKAVEDGVSEYGTFWRVDGLLRGPNGIDLEVSAIWLQWKADGTFHFVTLKPRRKKQ